MIEGFTRKEIKDIMRNKLIEGCKKYGKDHCNIGLIDTMESIKGSLDNMSSSEHLIFLRIKDELVLEFGGNPKDGVIPYSVLSQHF